MKIELLEDGEVHVTEEPPGSLIPFLFRDDLGLFLPSIDAVLQGINEVRTGARDKWEFGGNVTQMRVTPEGVYMRWGLNIRPNPEFYEPLDELEAAVRQLRAAAVEWASKHGEDE